MCLSVVTKKLKRPTPRIVYGYKIFDVSTGGYVFKYRDRHEVKTGAWMTALEEKIGYGRHTYTSGFHAFVSRPSEPECNMTEKIVRVRLRYVHTKGLQQHENKCIIAREMFVPKPRRKP